VKNTARFFMRLTPDDLARLDALGILKHSPSRAQTLRMLLAEAVEGHPCRGLDAAPPCPVCVRFGPNEIRKVAP
jgi:hypothetical protein